MNQSVLAEKLNASRVRGNEKCWVLHHFVRRRSKMKRFSALAVLLLLSSGLFAMSPQDTSNTSHQRKATTKTVSPSAASRIDKLEKLAEQQQQQIQQLHQELQSRDQAMQQMQQRLDQGLPASSVATAAESKADAAAAQASKLQQDINSIRRDLSGLEENSNSTALTLVETRKSISGLENPLALHFRGITITPGGLMAAQTVYRTRALGAEVTPFNAIPMPGASQTRMSEFYGSGRFSRFSLLAEGKVENAKLSGYIEGDFLSAGVTSNNTESNGYTLRQRQAWLQAALNNGWTFTGGQMWTLVTETRNGLDNRSEAVPMTIDTQLVAGMSWAWQYGFRVTKNFNNKTWLGFSVENPQTTFAAHGSANDFLIGSPGSTGGGAYNPSATYSFNKMPDFIVKAAFEPGFGHYEIFGILSDFRDRVYPCATTSATGMCNAITGPSAAGAFNNSATGGGLGANARVTLEKQFDIGLHFLGGKGVGRYGTSLLPDATVQPNGVLAILKNYQTLVTLELHKPKFDIYLNGGGEYVGRSWALNSAGNPVGYGSPLFNNSGCNTEPLPGTPGTGQYPISTSGFLPGGLANCTGDTRNILDGTFGFWYRLYNGSKGRLQFGSQYSYVVRNTWAGAGGYTPHGIENMVFTSFRYYLPGSAPAIKAVGN
jgi:hypothetical protein